MIRNSKQSWQLGQTVTVGLVKNLRVIQCVLTPGDAMPDKYILESMKGKLYEFMPYHGIRKLI
jgi:hypothetical protein